MKNRLVSLSGMIKLSNNPVLSESYIRYICGLDSEKQYRHQEINDIKSLLSKISLPEAKLSGFIYSYTVPQLNREFDLLKITNTCCLNIELKSTEISEEKIQKQLLQNRHYLKLLGRNLFLFTYVSSSSALYSLNENGELIQLDFSSIVDALTKIEEKALIIELDQIFAPKNTLVSPLNATDRFLLGDYILTENQENIKKDILSYIGSYSSDRFVGLSGGPGTGKTLVIYDLAKELSLKSRILIIHSGILCEGHNILNDRLSNIKIIAAKELKYREINNVDIVIVDEAHRLYTESLDKIERWVKRTKTTCILSYDAGQMLSKREKSRDITKRIDLLCSSYHFKLTNKIRTNKELALFITCLFDLSKYRSEYLFPNARIIYEPNKENVKLQIEHLKGEGYTYISFTPSVYYSYLDEQVDEFNTHNVIGQEFDGVCMVIDNHFNYDSSGKLNAVEHPNPDYILTQLLYQGLTRVRSKILVIVTSEKLLSKLLPLMKNS